MSNFPDLRYAGTGTSGVQPLGSIPYVGSAGPVSGGTLSFSSPGTSGQFLRSGGTGAPTWFTLFGSSNVWTADQVVDGSGTSTIPRGLRVRFANGTDANSSAWGFNGLQLGNNGWNYLIAGNSQVGGRFGFVTNNNTQLGTGQDFGGYSGNLAAVLLETGNFGLGISTPGSRFHAFAADGGNYAGRFENSAGSGWGLLIKAGSAGAATNLLGITDNSSNTLFLVTGDSRVGVNTGSPSASYTMDVAGTVHATSFPTSSDSRLKTNVQNLTGALAKLRQLQGVTFQWNQAAKNMGRFNRSLAANDSQIGFVAQDLASVLPEAVSKWDVNNPDSYLGIDYSRVVVLLVEAIKEAFVHFDNRLKALHG